MEQEVNFWNKHIIQFFIFPELDTFLHRLSANFIFNEYHSIRINFPNINHG